MQAATVSWSNLGADFATGANWLGGIAPANSLSTDTASFGTAAPAFQPVLAASRSIAGVSFANGAGAFTLSGAGILSLGASGITNLDDTVQTVSLSLLLGTNSGFTTGSTGTLVVSGPVDTNGFALTLGGTGAGASAISGIISGLGSATKLGTGSWNVSGNNTYSGGTTLTQGIVTAGHDNAFGSGVLNLNGATLQASAVRNLANAVSLTANSTIAGSQAITFQSFTLTGNRTLTATNTGLTTLANGISETGGPRTFTKAGTGALLVNAASTYTGATTISAGILALGAAGTISTANLTLDGGGVLATQGTFSRTLGTGSNQVQFGSAGGGFAAYGGALDVNGFTGTPIWGATANFLGAAATLQLNSVRSTDAVTVSTDFSLGSASRTINVNDNTASANDYAIISGVVSGAGGLIKTGTGRLDLVGTNTFAGAAEIRAGLVGANVLADSGLASSLGAGTGVSTAIRIGSTTTAAVLRYTGSGHSSNRDVALAGSTGGATLQADGTGALLLTGSASAVAAGAKILTLSGTGSGNNEIQGIITDGAGVVAVTKAGLGQWELSGSNTFTGGLSLSAGALVIGHNMALGTGTASLVSGTVGGDGTARTVANAVTVNGNITISGSSALTFGGNIQQINSRTLTFTNTGTTTFSGPAISLAESNQARTLTLAGAGNVLISAGIVDGAGTGVDGISKIGSGAVTFSSSNSYTGNTTLSAGVLAIGHDNALGNGSLLLAGGTLSGSGIVSRAFGNTTVLSANSGLGGSAALTFNGDLSQTGSRILTIANTVTFSGTYLTLAENDQTRILTIAGTGTAAILSVIRNGTGTGVDGLTKSGAGLLTLSGSNTYTGATTLTSGTLRATSQAAALGAGTLSAATGSTLQLANDTGLNFGRNTTLTGTGTMAVTSDRLSSGAGVTHTLGTLTVGAQTLELSAGGNVTSGTAGFTLAAVSLTASGAVLQAGAGTLLTTGSITGANRSFTIGGAGDTNVNGAVAVGTGVFSKSGAGVATLLGSTANTSTGATVINGGVLVLAKTAGVNALNSSTITVGDNSGTDILRLGASNQIVSTATLVLNGGTFDLNNYSEGLGSLDLNANSFINLGGTAAAATFANSSAQVWNAFTLSILNYNASLNLLRFGTTSTGLTSSQLANFRFADYGNVSGQIDLNGFVTPVGVPEPSCLVLLAGAGAALLGLGPRRRKNGRVSVA